MTLHHLQRPEGRIAWTSEGSGPLVVLVPGMGDSRSTWREIVEPLAATHRVVSIDLRGHGDSDTSFTRNGDPETAGDLHALIEHLDSGPAVLVGNSMGASAAAWAAAERPDLVAGLVLVSPFLVAPRPPLLVRWLMHTAYRLLFARPWGAALWARYYAGPLTRGHKAPWLAEHVAALRADLRRPGHLRSLRRLMVELDHSGVAERAARVTAPTLVVIGELDPDYGDPAGTLDQAVELMPDATGLLVPDAAHYPQHQAPARVLEAVQELLARIPAESERWSATRA